MIYSKIVIALILFVSAYSPFVAAHTPHDVVEDVAFSPQFSQDNTVYSLIRSNVLKSTDRGITWKRLVHGLDNKSSLLSLAADPVSPNFLYLSAISDGIYKSDNAGLSWQKVNATLQVNKFYVPPAVLHDVVFAADRKHGLYRTVNGGTKWIKVYHNLIPVSAIAGFSWNTKDGREVLIGDKNGSLFLSTDAGSSWAKIYDFPNCGEISTIATSHNPLLRNTFLLGTSLCGIFRTVDGGKSFQQANSALSVFNIRNIALSPSFDTDATVFASSGAQGMFISTNGGITWQKQSVGLTTDPQSPPENNFTELRASPDYKNDKTLFLAAFAGLFKTTNAGAQWTQLDTMPGGLIQSIAVSPNYNIDKTLALTTYYGGIYNSTDDGNTWNAIAKNIASRNNDITFSPAYASDGTMFTDTGLPVRIGKSTDFGKTWTEQTLPKILSGWPTIFALSPTFATDKTVFVLTRWAHVLKSINGGATFKSIYKKRESGCSYCVSGFAISPNFSIDQTLLFATTTNSSIYISHDGGKTWLVKGLPKTFGLQVKLAISPNYAQDHTIFMGGNLGLFRTVDGFETWTKVANNDGYIEELAVSPNFKNDNTLIISVRGKGLFKSEDRGLTFRAVGTALINDNYSIALWDDFPASSSLIKFSPSYAIDKTIFATSSDTLFRSKDGGETWTVLPKL